MPELPEVETVARSLRPRLVGKRLIGAVARRVGLREPFPDFQDEPVGQIVVSVSRRSKYLLVEFETGTLLVHLGMSGHLRWLEKEEPPCKHDHLDLVFAHGRVRLNDPRRFGTVLWQPKGETHRALAKLGPEPLEAGFDGKVLHKRLNGRSTPIKVAVMDAAVVVGVGNIYATEALFRAGIHPSKQAGDLSLHRCGTLVRHLRDVLNEGIAKGGSTLRDFHGVEGETGTFSAGVDVYGRMGLPCHRCGTKIESIRLGGRASAFCPRCQK
jgi:formamidopyrimidine-DNA glycosylase